MIYIVFKMTAPDARVQLEHCLICFCDSTEKNKNSTKNEHKKNNTKTNKTTTFCCIKHNGNVMYIKMKILLVTRKRPNDKTNECIMRLPSLDFYLWIDRAQKRSLCSFQKIVCCIFMFKRDALAVFRKSFMFNSNF